MHARPRTSRGQADMVAYAANLCRASPLYGSARVHLLMAGNGSFQQWEETVWSSNTTTCMKPQVRRKTRCRSQFAILPLPRCTLSGLATMVNIPKVAAAVRARGDELRVSRKDPTDVLQGQGVQEAHPAQGHPVQGGQGVGLCAGQAALRPEAVRLRWSDQARFPQEFACVAPVRGWR
jgi:hypothetical protein